MPITVYTGLPGHGKTSLMVEHLLAAAKKADRPIYAHGIDGLQPGIASSFDPRRWHEPGVVEDGALIFIDEAWKHFGHLHDARSAPTPPHVLALAEHRHRGLDFVFTTQAPAQLYPFCRSMIQDHHHVVRRFGSKFLDVFSWAELNDDVKSASKRGDALRKTRALPTKAWESYKSASVHTIKTRLPFRVVAMPLLVIAGAVLLWFAYHGLKPSNMAATVTGKSPSAAVAAPGLAGTGASKRALYSTAEEYAEAMRPRIPSIPWTAPAFDGRQVASDPHVYCMASGQPAPEGKVVMDHCRCVTEQGTLYGMPQDQCFDVARNGERYNPFLAPRRDDISREGRDPGTQSAPDIVPTAAAAPAVAATPPPETAG